MAGNRNSGRRPKPTALKVLAGNPGRRPLNEREPALPVVPDAFDEPPVELTADEPAKAEWRRIAPMLRKARVITEAERAALIALCQQWSRYIGAQGHLARLGMVVKAPNGMPIVNPYLTVADKALAHCTRLWTELGLTPSSRSKLSALPAAEAPKSNWAGLLT